jgi:hypothetical protein
LFAEYLTIKSCGYAVPFYTFKAQRNRLLDYSVNKEIADIEAESGPDIGESPPRPEKGLKWYWMFRNAKSLDGLPGVLYAHESTKPFQKNDVGFKKDDERVRTRYEGILDEYIDRKAVVGFAIGVLATISYARFMQT